MDPRHRAGQRLNRRHRRRDQQDEPRHHARDHTNDRKFYGCSQNGGCRGFAPGAPANGFNMTIPGQRANWVAPLEFSADPRIVFGASEFVHRMNTDPGQRTWERISPDLTDGPELPRAPGFGNITALGTTTADRTSSTPAPTAAECGSAAMRRPRPRT